jgi:hypothetical protein
MGPLRHMEDIYKEDCPATEPTHRSTVALAC